MGQTGCSDLYLETGLRTRPILGPSRALHIQHSLSAQMSNLGITGFLVVDLGEAQG